jgi:hypothetical protein
MKYNATPTACEALIPYGQVEDYTINIGTSGELKKQVTPEFHSTCIQIL